MSQLSRADQDKYIKIASGPLVEIYRKSGHVEETDLDKLDVPETEERAAERSQHFLLTALP
jgi:hypothetical protein